MTLKAGDILSSAWGYDQTNYDFYEVIKVSGKFATLRHLEQVNSWKNDNPAELVGTTVPIPGKYQGKEFRRMIKPNHWSGFGVKVRDFAWAYPWDGKPKHFTAYA